MLDSRHVLNSSEWDITTDLVTAGHMRQMHGVLYPAQEKSPADQHRLGRPLTDQAAAVDQGGVDNCFMDVYQLKLDWCRHAGASSIGPPAMRGSRIGAGVTDRYLGRHVVSAGRGR